MGCLAVLWTCHMLSCLTDFSCDLLAIWNVHVPESCIFWSLILFRFFSQMLLLSDTFSNHRTALPYFLPSFYPSICYLLIYSSTISCLLYKIFFVVCFLGTITVKISWGIFIWLYHVKLSLLRTWYLAHSGFLINIEWMNDTVVEQTLIRGWRPMFCF